MKTVHPLTPFVSWGAPAPYNTADFSARQRDAFKWHTRVVAVNCRTGLGRGSSKGPVRYVHRVQAMAAVFANGRMELAARWLCSAHGTKSAAVVANTDGYEMCPACEDRHAGPAVYRLSSEDRRLLYVGASTQLTRRLRQHQLGKPWWDEIAEVHIERFADTNSAFSAEDAAIASEAPIYNQPRFSRRSA